MTLQHRWAATALAITLLAVAPATYAQSKKELVAKVVQLRQPAVDRLARTIAMDPAQTALNAARQVMQIVPADKREALGKQVQGDVKAFYDDTEARLRESGSKNAAATIGPILEEKFTEEELKLIITWLESSAAKKYEQLEPEMQAQLTRKMVEDTKPAVEPKLRALEDTLKKRFAAYAPPPGASAPVRAPSPATSPATPASAPKPPAKK
jgi:uncharacterized protein